MRITNKDLIETMNKMEMETSITRLQNFPWSNLSFDELITLVNKREITLGVLYDSDARHIILSRKEKIFSDIIGNIMFLIPLGFIISAIWTKEWLLLIGTPGFLVAAFVSSPWARNTRLVLILCSLVIIIMSIYFHYSILALIFGGLFLSLNLAVYAREYVNQIVKSEIIKSEPLLCFTFQKGLLLIKDKKTDRIYGK